MSTFSCHPDDENKQIIHQNANFLTIKQVCDILNSLSPTIDKAQYATSIEADFGKNTWTFKINESNKVGPGKYMIIKHEPSNQSTSQPKPVR